MDVVDETLTNASINMEYQLAIRAAANLAKKTINRYYSKTDLSETYQIAMRKCSDWSYELPSSDQDVSSSQPEP